MQLISSEYQQKIQDIHQRRQGIWGARSSPWRFLAIHLMGYHKIRSVLDYGCGKAHLEKITKIAMEQQGLRELKFYNYDPGIPEYATLIDFPVQMVVCVDVMAHTEDKCIDNNIETIYNLTERPGIALFAINLRPSYLKEIINKEGKLLAPQEDFINFAPDYDRYSEHISVHPKEWWLEKFNKYNWNVNRLPLTDKYLICYISKK